MGTNFYWIKNEEGHLPGGITGEAEFLEHIGKRSAAGQYCWDCGVPLVEPGRRSDGYGQVFVSDDVVHGGKPRATKCPVCWKEPDPKRTDLRTPGNPAGVELGFAAPLQQRPSGVCGASSFLWAQEPARVFRILGSFPDTKLMRDQYGAEYTGREAHELLMSIPLWFTSSIATSFS